VNRRQIIAGLGGAAAWPIVARGQQAAIPVVGYLSGVSQNGREHLTAAFRRGLDEQGFAEAKNVKITFRYADQHYDRLSAIADDFVRSRVAIIAAMGTTPGALAAKAATQTSPIVFLIGTDPVKAGLVTSLARPEGNLTGVTNLVVELTAKCLSLLREVMPTMTSVGLLVNPSNPVSAESEARDAQVVATLLGIRLLMAKANVANEIDQAFADLSAQKVGGLLIGGDSLFLEERNRLAALASRYTLPTINQYREYAAAGGLMSYGTILADAYRVAGSYVGRILNGQKPADLPVQQSTKVELVINMKVAKALGLTIPLPLLGRADEVIE
jgi:putative tryptophan/tyrosine transport system substrate-binding protein